MNCEQGDRYEPWTVKKITHELDSSERELLDSHLDQCNLCAAREQKLIKTWQTLDVLPDFEIPNELYELTENRILGQLRDEKIPYLRLLGLDFKGPWLPLFAGLVMTGISIGLVKNLIDLTTQHHYILIVLFVLWGLVFSAFSWFMLSQRVQKPSSMSIVSGLAVPIVLLTLVVARLCSWADFAEWIEGIQAYRLLVARFAGLGAELFMQWAGYACAASFVGAVFLGLRRAPHSLGNAFLASLFISALLFPAIYLHVSSHLHGYGILFFGAFGSFLGTLVGIALANWIRRWFLVAAA